MAGTAPSAPSARSQAPRTLHEEPVEIARRTRDGPRPAALEHQENGGAGVVERPEHDRAAALQGVSRG
ncbi:hypothetical protein [Streptomyces sp. HB132]|uniref:hypothetical protein n=1 Tax=Streptomyces sp. HB132 TaxID=767388 RepID=UPI001961105E|nr:hypothetical protein [Streptomyces sp. HB132]